MSFPIYKSRDADNIRVYADEIRPGVWSFSQTKGFEARTPLGEFSREEAEKLITSCRAKDAICFGRYFGGQPSTSGGAMPLYPFHLPPADTLSPAQADGVDCAYCPDPSVATKPVGHMCGVMLFAHDDCADAHRMES